MPSTLRLSTPMPVTHCQTGVFSFFFYLSTRILRLLVLSKKIKCFKSLSFVVPPIVMWGRSKECWNSIEANFIAMPSAPYALLAHKQLGPKTSGIFRLLCLGATSWQIFFCQCNGGRVLECAVRPGVVYASLFWPDCSCAQAAGPADPPPSSASSSRKAAVKSFFLCSPPYQPPPHSPRPIQASPRIGDARLAAFELCDLDRMWNPG